MLVERGEVHCCLYPMPQGPCLSHGGGLDLQIIYNTPRTMHILSKKERASSNGVNNHRWSIDNPIDLK